MAACGGQKRTGQRAGRWAVRKRVGGEDADCRPDSEGLDPEGMKSPSVWLLREAKNSRVNVSGAAGTAVGVGPQARRRHARLGERGVWN